MTTDHDERADLLSSLAKHRKLFCATTQGISDADAARRTTASELCLGGLVKHLTRMEGRWDDFIEGGAEAMPTGAAAFEAHQASFRMLEGDTLAGLLESYAAIARRTDELVTALPSLDISHPLPEAPWYEPGEHWSARRVLLHVLAETAQHAGHADIIREALDGAKTMG